MELTSVGVEILKAYKEHTFICGSLHHSWEGRSHLQLFILTIGFLRFKKYFFIKKTASANENSLK